MAANVSVEGGRWLRPDQGHELNRETDRAPPLSCMSGKIAADPIGS
jgi:hypothetical protein